MKTPDITSRVMEDVITFEKKRSKRFLWGFSLLVLVLGFISLILGIQAIQNIYEFQTLDALTLLGQDREIIFGYWQEAAFILENELPWDLLIPGGMIVLGIVGLVLVTRNRRRLTQKRLQNVAKYKKKE